MNDDLNRLNLNRNGSTDTLKEDREKETDQADDDEYFDELNAVSVHSDDEQLVRIVSKQTEQSVYFEHSILLRYKLV